VLNRKLWEGTGRTREGFLAGGCPGQKGHAKNWGRKASREKVGKAKNGALDLEVNDGAVKC